MILNPNPLYFIALMTVLGAICGSALVGAAIGLGLVNLEILASGAERSS